MNTTIAPARPPRAARATAVRPSLAPPMRARMARATIGMPSLAKLSQMPVTTTVKVARDREKPQDVSMA